MRMRDILFTPGLAPPLSKSWKRHCLYHGGVGCIELSTQYFQARERIIYPILFYTISVLLMKEYAEAMGYAESGKYVCMYVRVATQMKD